MNTSLKSPQSWLALLLLVALTSGCATPALWHATATHEWYPYTLDQVVLLTETNHQQELAVFFTQAWGSGKDTKTRAVGWRVSDSPGHLAVTSAAIRRLTNAAPAMQPLPILRTDEVATNAAGQPPRNIVRSAPPAHFTVYLSGFPPQPYTLPVTRQTYYTVRTCFLPITVTADTTLFLLAALGSGYWK